MVRATASVWQRWRSENPGESLEQELGGQWQDSSNPRGSSFGEDVGSEHGKGTGRSSC